MSKNTTAASRVHHTSYLSIAGRRSSEPVRIRWWNGWVWL